MLVIEHTNVRDEAPERRRIAPSGGSIRFRAMGCEMAAWLVDVDSRAAARHLTTAPALVETVEARLSRFRPQSELSRLNARSGQTVAVSKLLWQAVSRALAAAACTGGLYDPTVVDALEAAGYDRSFTSILDAHSPARPVPPPRMGWRDVRLDPAPPSVTLPPGVRLDLGGIAKAWTAERVADRLARFGPCLVDAGGDIALRSRPADQPGWAIGVADPRRPERDLALLLLQGRGVATSGVDYRRWRRGGMIQHHIIDPRTRRPAETDLLSATIVAGDASEANLHALVAMVLGASEGLAYLTHQPGVEGLLIGDDGRLHTTPGFEQYVYAWEPQ